MDLKKFIRSGFSTRQAMAIQQELQQVLPVSMPTADEIEAVTVPAYKSRVPIVRIPPAASGAVPVYWDNGDGTGGWYSSELLDLMSDPATLTVYEGDGGTDSPVITLPQQNLGSHGTAYVALTPGGYFVLGATLKNVGLAFRNATIGIRRILDVAGAPVARAANFELTSQYAPAGRRPFYGTIPHTFWSTKSADGVQGLATTDPDRFVSAAGGFYVVNVSAVLLARPEDDADE